MAKHKIAVLPGDGVGRDVMDAAMIVLKELRLDAEYKKGDIGWEFWKKEGNPLPDRTIEVLRSTDAALFGAITSLPKEEAEAELVPELQGKKLVYRSPIVRLRQEFHLRTNRRPCFAFPGNPLNYRDGIDLVVFRENTEGLYSGVEFHPIPKQVFETFREFNPKVARFDKHGLDKYTNMIQYGGSPRASINLAMASKAYAFIKRRGYVIPEDVRAVCHDVLRHRIGLSYEAEAENIVSEDIIIDILNTVEVP